jgi:mRNA-degrading endonuclease RelE of RelBE toxin-antitoxin system
MSYQVFLSENAEKFLEKLGVGEEERIRGRIEKRKDNPQHYIERKGDT